MIVYGGIIQRNKQKFIVFKKDGEKVEIPIEDSIADRIYKYLLKLSGEDSVIKDDSQ